MTWGGGMGGMGGPGGGGLGAVGSGPGRPGVSGLPFAGIPSELQDGVDRLLESEPDYPESDLVFSQNASSSGCHSAIQVLPCVLIGWVSLRSSRMPRRHERGASVKAGCI